MRLSVPGEAVSLRVKASYAVTRVHQGGSPREPVLKDLESVMARVARATLVAPSRTRLNLSALGHTPATSPASACTPTKSHLIVETAAFDAAAVSPATTLSGKVQVKSSLAPIIPAVYGPVSSCAPKMASASWWEVPKS